MPNDIAVTAQDIGKLISQFTTLFHVYEKSSLEKSGIYIQITSPTELFGKKVSQFIKEPPINAASQSDNILEKNKNNLSLYYINNKNQFCEIPPMDKINTSDKIINTSILADIQDRNKNQTINLLGPEEKINELKNILNKGEKEKIDPEKIDHQIAQTYQRLQEYRAVIYDYTEQICLVEQLIDKLSQINSLADNIQLRPLLKTNKYLLPEFMVIEEKKSSPTLEDLVKYDHNDTKHRQLAEAGKLFFVMQPHHQNMLENYLHNTDLFQQQQPIKTVLDTLQHNHYHQLRLKDKLLRHNLYHSSGTLPTRAELLRKLTPEYVTRFDIRTGLFKKINPKEPTAPHTIGRTSSSFKAERQARRAIHHPEQALYQLAPLEKEATESSQVTRL